MKHVDKRIACVTMFRDEDLFLRIWHDYYSKLFGPENCFIIDHNSSVTFPQDVISTTSSRANFIRLPFEDPKNVGRNFDRARFLFIFNFVSSLLHYYDTVIRGRPNYDTGNHSPHHGPLQLADIYRIFIGRTRIPQLMPLGGSHDHLPR